jgi:hypothetical protein
MNIDNIAHLISLCFGLFVLFCFAQGYFYGATNTSVFTDKIDLGYIRIESESESKPEPIKVVLSNSKPPKQNIKNECYKILLAIGYSEDTAKEMIRGFFKHNTANSVEEFFVKINKS